MLKKREVAIDKKWPCYLLINHLLDSSDIYIK